MSSPRPAPLAARLSLAAGALVFFLVAAEVTLRAAQGAGWAMDYSAATIYPKNEFAARLVKSDNPVLYAEPAPDDPNFNSDGVRDIERSVAKETGHFRILVLGDSVTFGHGVAREDIYVQRLEALFAESGRTPHVEVLNFGVTGYGTEQELEFYRLRGAKYQPDLLLVGYVLNDPLKTEFMFQAAKDQIRKARAQDAIASWSQFLALVWYRIEVLRDARQRPTNYETIYSHDVAWATVANAFAGLGEISRERGIPVIVAIFPLLEDFDDYPFTHAHQQVREAAEAEGLVVFDLTPTFARNPAEHYKLTTLDVTHPNAEGHRVAAEALYAYLVDGDWIRPSAARRATLPERR